MRELLYFTLQLLYAKCLLHIWQSCMLSVLWRSLSWSLVLCVCATCHVGLCYIQCCSILVWHYPFHTYIKWQNIHISIYSNRYQRINIGHTHALCIFTLQLLYAKCLLHIWQSCMLSVLWRSLSWSLVLCVCATCHVGLCYIMHKACVCPIFILWYRLLYIDICIFCHLI
jgi:hypothetical protein